MNFFEQKKPTPLSEKLTEGIDYTKENGLLVFTATYLKKRGNCCQNGCINCPFGFTNSTKERHEKGGNPTTEVYLD